MPKFAEAGRFIQRKRIIKSIGLDTDIFIALINNNEEFTLFKPKIFNRKNSLYINYKVFSETLGILIHKYKYEQYNALRKIFEFLRINNICLLKKKETDLNQILFLLTKLKRYRESIKSLAGNNDLEIIAIYKLHNINCIMGRNIRHFLPFCNYLHIEFEKLEENIDIMFRQAFGWKKRNRKY